MEYKYDVLVDGARFRVLCETDVEEDGRTRVDNLTIQEKVSDSFVPISNIWWSKEKQESILVHLGKNMFDMLSRLTNLKSSNEVHCLLEEYLNCVDFAENVLLDIYSAW